MSDSWEEENEGAGATVDGDGEIGSQGETLASDEVLCEWIERLENELAKRDATILELKRSLDDPDVAEANAERDDAHRAAGSVEETHVEVIVDHDDERSAASYRISRGTHTTQEQFHRIEALESEIANREDLIRAMREQATSHEAKLLKQKADWEHLHLWVEQVEQRIEQSGYYDAIFNTDPLPVMPSKGKTLAPPSVPKKEAWEIERVELNREVAALKAELANSQNAQREAEERLEDAINSRPSEVPQIAVPSPDVWELEREKEGLIELLQRERNEFDELRTAYDTLLQQIEAHELEMQEKFEAIQRELDETIEREKKSAEQNAEHVIQANESNRMEPDERIRAFRLHLDKIHSEQSATRSGRGGLLGISWFRSDR